MDAGFEEEENVTGKRETKLVHEGEYIVQVEVELLESEEGWSPYLSLADARKLEAARQALRRGDLKAAAQLGKVFRLMPVAA